MRHRLDDQGDSLRATLAELLTPAEIEALQNRLARLIERTNFPKPGAGRHYPWPPV